MGADFSDLKINLAVRDIQQRDAVPSQLRRRPVAHHVERVSV